mgnify:CR=1 FL=1
MEFKLKITMADPAGNRTAFAEGEVPPELYAAVGAAILKEEDLNAEQAGFLLKPLRRRAYGDDGRGILRQRVPKLWSAAGQAKRHESR